MSDRKQAGNDPLELNASGLFKNAADAERAFLRALPSYRCPACMNELFSLVDMLDEGLVSTLDLHKPDEAVASKWVPTVTFACDNCGYVTTFYTGALKALADQNIARHVNG